MMLLLCLLLDTIDTFKLLGCQSRHSVGIEGEFFYSKGFEKVTLTILKNRLLCRPRKSLHFLLLILIIVYKYSNY